jgi:hypothetical protein
MTIPNDPGHCGGTAHWEPPGFIDNCGEPGTHSNHQPGDFFPVGDTHVRYTATDMHGNTTMAGFRVTVIDVEPPEMHPGHPPPEDITIPNDPGHCGGTAHWEPPGFIDNCGEPGTHSNFQPGDFFPVGDTDVRYTATDMHGNTTMAGFRVTVIDVEPPEMHPGHPPPEDITIPNDPGHCGGTAHWEPPGFIDNCGEPGTHSNHQPGDFFPVGDTDVRYTATDMHGNTTMAGFRVTVIDVEPPEMHPDHPPPENIIQPNDQGSCGAIVTWTPPIFIDNCSDFTIVTNFQPGQFFPVGATEISYKATDSNENFMESSFIVEIYDATAPGIKCPSNLDLFVDDPPQPDPVFLTGAAPEGGTYEGNGISNGYFNPYVAGIGIHSITYVYVNPESTCVYSCAFTIQVSPATGTIDKTETQELFKVYPNPNRGAFTISGPEKPALIEVIDMIGRTIWEQETSLPSNIVVTDTPKGMYFVKIVCDQRMSIHKILIE